MSTLTQPPVKSAQNPKAGKADGPDLIATVFQVLRTRKKEVGLWVIFCLAVAVAWAFLSPPYYDSYVQMMPPNMSGEGAASALAGMAGGSNAAAIQAADFLGIKSNGAVYIGVLNSRTVADNIVRKFELQKYYKKRTMAEARLRLASDTSTSEDRKSGIITIRVRMHDPRLAADIANTYAHELDVILLRNNTTSAHRQRVFLEERLKTVKSDLDGASSLLSQYSSKSMTLEPTEQARAMLQIEASLGGELIAAETELESLKQIYTPQMVQNSADQARVNELRQQIQHFEHGGGSSASSLPAFGKLPLLAEKYADLFRHVKTQEAVYALLTQQYEIAKMNEAKDVPSVQVLDEAIPAEKKSGPSRRGIVIVGAVLGLLLGLAFESARRLWSELPPDHRLKSALASMRANA